MEERDDRTDAFYRVQAIFDWASRDVALRSVEQVIVGGDPFLWTLAARALARKGAASTLAIFVPSSFQGSPLAALHDEVTRSRVSGLREVTSAEIKSWMELCAAACLEASVKVLWISDSCSLFVNQRRASLFLDREGVKKRRSAFVQREEFGLALSDVHLSRRALQFSAESERLFLEGMRSFKSSHEQVICELDKARRYADVVCTQSVFLATTAESHIRMLNSYKDSTIRTANFAVCSAASISTAVEAWCADIDSAASGFCN